MKYCDVHQQADPLGDKWNGGEGMAPASAVGAGYITSALMTINTVKAFD